MGDKVGGVLIRRAKETNRLSPKSSKVLSKCLCSYHLLFSSTYCLILYEGQVGLFSTAKMSLGWVFNFRVGFEWVKYLILSKREYVLC